MKKLLSILLFSCMTLTMSAQEIMNEINRLAKETVANTNRTMFERGIAQFKVDAIEYIVIKTSECMPDSSATILDDQSYALYEFCRYYFTATLKSQSDAGKRNIRAIFKEVSLANPRFNDQELDIAHAYINATDPVIVTPFSLDTDWEKALIELQRRGYSY